MCEKQMWNYNLMCELWYLRRQIGKEKNRGQRTGHQLFYGHDHTLFFFFLEYVWSYEMLSNNSRL